jgi:hypothetical protein
LNNQVFRNQPDEKKEEYIYIVLPPPFPRQILEYKSKREEEINVQHLSCSKDIKMKRKKRGKVST